MHLGLWYDCRQHGKKSEYEVPHQASLKYLQIYVHDSLKIFHEYYFHIQNPKRLVLCGVYTL